MERQISRYYASLDKIAKARYLSELDQISPNCADSCTYSPRDGVSAVYPKIEYPDFYNYLVCSVSVYTKDQSKAYRSLDGYKYLVAGWVGNIMSYTLDSKVVLTATV